MVTGDEADLLRVHLDTARSQVLAQYPKIDTALLLNCMLLAATEAFVVGDPVSANYHFSWFQELGDAGGGPVAGECVRAKLTAGAQRLVGEHQMCWARRR